MSRTARSKTSLRYAFDDLNRLRVRERDGAAGRLRPARILEGVVTTDRDNRLLYRVDASTREDGALAPRAIALDGTWRLTADHQLALALHESDEQERQTLYLKGAVIKAEADALVFALRQREDGEDTAQRLTLSGRWRADAQNRLNFLVDKADGSEDRLTLQGGWEVGPHHELLYRYQRRDGARRDRDAHTLIFDGTWDIPGANRLVYRLAGSDTSAFEFRAALRSPSLNAREGRIVYEIGVGVSRGVTARKRVTLFGTWKLNRDLSVSFEIPYAEGRVQAIRFEGTVSLSPRNRIAVALSSSERTPLGLTVTFTRELFPDAGLFLQLRKSAEETAALGGVRVRF